MKGKLYTLFSFLIFFTTIISAQDIITKVNGEEIPVKVTEVNRDDVKYKKFSNQSGPAYVILKSEIFMIKYEDGDKDLFVKNEDTGEISVRHITNPNRQSQQLTAKTEAETKNQTKASQSQKDLSNKPVTSGSAPTPATTSKKRNAPGKDASAAVKFENETYTVYIGEISKGENGKLIVELLGDKIGGSVPFRNGRIIVPIAMKVVVAEKTISYENCSLSNDSHRFHFETTGMPEKIIVYGNDGKNSAEVIFDGKTKKLIGKNNEQSTVSNTIPEQSTKSDPIEAKGFNARNGEHDIVDLLENNIIEIEIQGGDITYVNTRIRRLVTYPVKVRIPVGSYFVSANTSSQNMVGTAEKKISLITDNWQNISVPAACANRPKNIPDSKDRFTVTRSPHQAELAALMPVLDKAKAGTTTKQAAVWIITDNANYSELGILVSGNTRAIGPTDTARAMQICSEAGIDIRKKRIWSDKQTILEKLPDGSLKNWLKGL